jgi:hypothetical protein
MQPQFNSIGIIVKYIMYYKFDTEHISIIFMNQVIHREVCLKVNLEFQLFWNI